MLSKEGRYDMNTSVFELLKKPAKVVLSAGHGGSDSGGVFGKFEESQRNRLLGQCHRDCPECS
jgi:hypothetical protein